MDGKDSADTVCGICGAALDVRPAFRVGIAGTAYDIVPCRRCGGAATRPVPSPADLSRFYGFRAYRASDGGRFNALAEKAVGWARDARRRRIERLAGRRGRLLDVGCGRGLFLRRMRRAGWEVAGVEVDPATARSLSEAYGLDVRAGAPGCWGFPDESFDVATFHHVLEHVPQPRDMVARCRRLLRDGGLLVAAVPNRDSLQAAFGREMWLHLDVPFHLHHFTASGLARLLEASGFQVVRTRHLDVEQNVFGWVQTLLNRIGLPRNLLFEFLKRPDLRADTSAGGHAWKLALSLVLLPLVLPAGAVLSVLESSFGRGGTVEIAAVKEGR